MGQEDFTFARDRMAKYREDERIARLTARGAGGSPIGPENTPLLPPRPKSNDLGGLSDLLANAPTRRDGLLDVNVSGYSRDLLNRVDAAVREAHATDKSGKSVTEYGIDLYRSGRLVDVVKDHEKKRRL